MATRRELVQRNHNHSVFSGLRVLQRLDDGSLIFDNYWRSCGSSLISFGNSAVSSVVTADPICSR
jgi:hypothetical protein